MKPEEIVHQGFKSKLDIGETVKIEKEKGSKLCEPCFFCVAILAVKKREYIIVLGSSRAQQ